VRLTGFLENLTEIFHIDRFFWENLGIDANGFFRGHADLHPSTGQNNYCKYHVTCDVEAQLKTFPSLHLPFPDQVGRPAPEPSCRLPLAICCICFLLVKERQRSTGRGCPVLRSVPRARRQQAASTSEQHSTHVRTARCFGKAIGCYQLSSGNVQRPPGNIIGRL
jgi:hypothetical protein